MPFPKSKGPISPSVLKSFYRLVISEKSQVLSKDKLEAQFPKFFQDPYITNQMLQLLTFIYSDFVFYESQHLMFSNEMSSIYTFKIVFLEFLNFISATSCSNHQP